MPRKSHALGVSFSVLSAVVCQVASAESADIGNNVELRLRAGVLNGTSNEYVYDADGSSYGVPGHKLSELVWELNSVPVANVGLSFPISNTVKLNVDYWSNIGDGSGTLDDYDWRLPGYPWTDWSHHNDTTVSDLTRADANAAISFYSMDGNKTKIQALVGYRQDYLSWDAKGGYAIYSNPFFRDTYYVFGDVKVISYEQTFNTPYIGIGFESDTTSGHVKMHTSASIRYSQWVSAEDIDNHYLRDLRIEQEASDGQWYGVELNMDFEVSKNWSFLFGYSYQAYSEMEASKKYYDTTTNTLSFALDENFGGMKHSSDIISIGTTYRF